MKCFLNFCKIIVLNFENVEILFSDELKKCTEKINVEITSFKSIEKISID